MKIVGHGRTLNFIPLCVRATNRKNGWGGSISEKKITRRKRKLRQ